MSPAASARRRPLERSRSSSRPPATSLALASIPGPDGTIHGCYSRRSGKLRVVDEATPCRKREQAIAFNQQGPPGDGGALAGTYPNPAIADRAVTPAQIGAIPTVRVGGGVDQPTASGAITTLSFGFDAFDPLDMHSTTSAPSRLIAPVTGVYLVTANVPWRASGGGTQRYVALRANGSSSDIATNQAAPVNSVGSFTVQTLATQVKLSAGDYVELRVLQDSGGTLNVANNASFQMTWVAPG